MSIDEVEVGMRVRVMDKRPENTEEDPGWNSHMDWFLGKTVTIGDKSDAFVFFVEDPDTWVWHPAWLTPVEDDTGPDDVADDASIESLFC